MKAFIFGAVSVLVAIAAFFYALRWAFKRGVSDQKAKNAQSELDDIERAHSAKSDPDKLIDARKLFTRDEE
ncbi:MAG: hypothetical protein AAFO69_09210 [Bacteroidota bacterium]